MLLASPSSASSDWVAFELAHWMGLGRAEQLLPVLCDGEWVFAGDGGAFTGTASAPQVLHDSHGEPRYLDLRWARGARRPTLRNPRFREAIGEIAAAVLGVPKDELVGEQIRVRNRRTRLLTVGAVGLTAAMGVASVAAVQARRSNDRAERSDRASRSRGMARLALQQDSAVSDQSVLLAAEAVTLDPTPDAIAAGMSALQRRGPVLSTMAGTLGVDWKFAADGSLFGELDGRLARLDPVTVTPTPLFGLAEGQAFVGVNEAATLAIIRGQYPGPLHVLDATTGEPRSAVIPAGDFASSAIFTDDDTKLLVARDSGVVERVDLVDGRVLDTLIIDGFQPDQSHVAFAADGSAFVVRVNDDSEVAWYPIDADGEVGEREVLGEDGGVTGVYETAISADGSTVAVAKSSGESTAISIIDVRTGVRDVSFLNSPVTSLAVASSRGTTTAAFGVESGVVSVIRDGEFVWDPLVAGLGTWGVELSRNGQSLAIDNGRELLAADLSRTGPVRRLLSAPSTPFDALVTGDRVAVLLREGVLVDDLSDGDPAQFAVDLRLDGVVGITLARSEDGHPLLVTGSPTGARTTDLDDGTTNDLRFDDHSGGVWRTTRDRRYVVAYSPTSLLVFDPRDGSEIARVPAPEGTIDPTCCAAIGADGSLMVTWTSDSMTITDLSSGEATPVDLGVGPLVEGADVISGKRVLATVGGRLRVFGADGSPALPFELPVPTGFSPATVETAGDGRYAIVVGVRDEDVTTFAVYDLDNASITASGITIPGAFQQLSESPDGDQVAIATTEGVWGVDALWSDPDALVRSLCASVSRGWTEQEVRAYLPAASHPAGCS